MQETGGTYGVALNEKHFEELVFEHAPPPPALADNTAASLVGGFTASQLDFPEVYNTALSSRGANR